jgi:hypothetical protein
LARRHPSGESEGILDGPTPMVRPHLRRDMAGVPKSQVLRSESRCGVPRGNVFATAGGPQSLLGNPVPRDGSEPRPSARISRK